MLSSLFLLSPVHFFLFTHCTCRDFKLMFILFISVYFVGFFYVFFFVSFFFFIIRNFSFCRWYLLLISHNEHSFAYTFFSLLSSVFKLTAFGCSLLSLFLSSFLVVYVAFAISVGVLYRNDFDDTGKTE